MDANLTLLPMCCENRSLRGKNGGNLRRGGVFNSTMDNRKTENKRQKVYENTQRKKNCKRIMFCP